MTPLPATLITLVEARHAGLTLRQAAAKAGVHTATVCRWQKRDPEIKQWLQQATEAGTAERREPPPERPGVYWRKDCPECKARVVVRKAGGELRPHKLTSGAVSEGGRVIYPGEKSLFT
jgi:hypothetical protein